MRIVIATNFQILDEQASDFWNRFARQLDQRGIRLVLLTTTVHEALTLPFLEIPYTLAGYAQYEFRTPANNGFLRSQIELEACWQTEENLERVELGAATCAVFFASLLDAADPDLVLSWNTLLPQSRILQIACAERGIPCQTIEHGLLPGTLLVDPTGNHVDGSLANSFALSSVVLGSTGGSDSVARYREWYGQERAVKYRQDDDADFRRLAERAARARRTLLILGPAIGTGLEPAEQKMSRRTLPGIRDRGAVLEAAARALGDDTLLIFRDHPINRVIGRPQHLPAGMEWGQDASLFDYLEIADHVLVIGGTTAAYEGLVARKPVMVVGRNMLMRFAACAQSDGLDLADDLVAFMRTQWSDHAEQADRALSFLLDHYLIMLAPGLSMIGNRLEDLVAFIDGYDSRTTTPHDERYDGFRKWRDELPMEAR